MLRRLIDRIRAWFRPKPVVVSVFERTTRKLSDGDVIRLGRQAQELLGDESLLRMILDEVELQAIELFRTSTDHDVHVRSWGALNTAREVWRVTQAYADRGEALEREKD